MKRGVVQGNTDLTSLGKVQAEIGIREGGQVYNAEVKVGEEGRRDVVLVVVDG